MRNYRFKRVFEVRRAAVPVGLLGALVWLVGGIAAGTAWANPPVGYYDSVDTATPETLRQTLHEVIDDHTRFPYTSGSTDTWDILNQADQDPANSGRILDVYRNRSFAKYTGGNTDYNREHVWPNSYGFPSAGDIAYTDCHHLFLCDIGYNGARDRRHFDFCSEGANEWSTYVNNGQGGGTGTYPGNSNWACNGGPAGIWEVWIGRRGDVARAMLYTDLRYEGGTHSVTHQVEPDLVLTNNLGLIGQTLNIDGDEVTYLGLLAVLKQWHLEDPVDDVERNRNDVVFSYQGNRNPFIDHPEWVEVLYTPARKTSWGSMKAMFR